MPGGDGVGAEPAGVEQPGRVVSLSSVTSALRTASITTRSLAGGTGQPARVSGRLVVVAEVVLHDPVGEPVGGGGVDPAVSA